MFDNGGIRAVPPRRNGVTTGWDIPELEGVDPSLECDFALDFEKEGACNHVEEEGLFPRPGKTDRRHGQSG